jgi:CubicO group peptidase (beta-lactamase class C family)
MGSLMQLDSVFDRLEAHVRAGDVPSAALAVGGPDGPVRVETFPGAGDSFDAQSLFFLASLTKPIFATGFMQLVEDGTVELHQPIVRWLPEFAGAPAGAAGRERVTPWHLLTHTSGVPDIAMSEMFGRRPSAQRLLAMTLAAPLRFEPGTHWQYCTASFYLLGEIIRRATGMPYPRFLAERLFEPLGMAATFDPRGGERSLVMVHGVGAENRLRRWLMLRYISRIAIPGGGLWATLDDILRFGAAWLRPRQDAAGRWLPLAPTTIAMMGEDQTRGEVGDIDDDGRRVHFGLSWGKPTLSGIFTGSPRVIAHGGVTGSRLWIDPDAELVFAYFTNQWSPDRGPEAEALAGVYDALDRPAPLSANSGQTALVTGERS